MASLRALMICCAVLFGTALHGSTDGELVIVYEDWHRRPVRLSTLPSTTSGGNGIEAVWVWSSTAAPRRTTPANAEREQVRRAAGRFTVVVDKASLDPRLSLTLHAAPAAMWEEVPEALLPSWSVRPGGAVTIPREGAGMWRARVVGEGVGSWWVDVPPQRERVVVVPVAARDLRMKVVTGEAAAVDAARVSFLDEGAHRGGWKKWAEQRASTSGDIVVRSLPDTRPLVVIASTRDAAPAVADGLPSTLPSTVVLPHGTTVRGRLSDRDGNPVGSATVEVESWIAERLPIPIARTAKSAADGSWEVAALPAGRAELRVEAGGFAAISRGLDLDGPSLDVGMIALVERLPVIVEVGDERGEPVSGASVSLDNSRPLLTDKGGCATVSAAAGETARLRISAPGHRPKETNAGPRWPERLRVTLRRTFQVTGRVVDSGGVPLAEGTVDARRLDGGFTRHSLQPNGTFVLDLEPETAFELDVKSPRAAFWTVDLAPGNPGERRELGDVVVPLGVSLTGRVLRKGDGGPVIGAHVWMTRSAESGPLMAWAFRDVLETESAVDGTFVLSGLSGEPAELRVDAAGLAPLRKLVTPVPDTPQTSLGDLELDSGSTVSVTLDGDDGRDVEVRMDLAGRGLRIDMLRQPLVGGQATFASVPEGKHAVTAWRGRSLLCRQVVSVAASEEAEVKCVARRVAVNGTVRVGERPAGPGILTFVAPHDEAMATGIFNFGSGHLRQQQVFTPDAAREVLQVGFDGRFSGQLLPGTWQAVWASEPGHALAPRQVTIPEAQAYELTLSYPGAVVRGTVRDADGKPVPLAQVRELGGGGFARSGPDGRFVLAGPPAGVWQIRATHEGRASAVRSVAVEEQREPDPVDLVLDQAPESVRVAVTMDELPAPGAIVFVQPEAGTLRVATADRRGIAEVRFTPPAPQRIRVAAVASGRWALGSWIRTADAADGVQVPVVTGGTVAISSRSASGPLVIASEDGWRIDQLLQWTGTAIRLAPEAAPLLLSLPPGRFEVGCQDRRVVISIRSNESVEARLE